MNLLQFNNDKLFEKQVFCQSIFTQRRLYWHCNKCAIRIITNNVDSS